MNEPVQTAVPSQAVSMPAVKTSAPQPPQVQWKGPQGKKWIAWAIVVASFFIVIFVGLLCLPKGVWLEGRALVNRYILGDDFFVVNSKSTTQVVVVDTVRLTNDSTLVVFNADLFDSPGFSILGESDVLSAGVHENISIRINPEAYFNKEDRSLLVTPTSGMSAYIGILEHTEGEKMRFDKMGYPVIRKLTLH